MPFEADVIILGAGAAGLAAGAQLGRAGLKILIVEARDRVGGRMFTMYDSATNARVELGAEFVHGKPPEICNLVKKHNLRVREVAGDNWCFQKGELCPCDFFSEVSALLEKMDDRSPDESFLDFIERCCPDDDDEKQREIKAWARGYVTGFHAADPKLISVNSLVAGLRADEKIDGERAFRIANGYESLVEIFRRELDAAQVKFALNTVVESIHWERQNVRISAHNTKGPTTFRAPRVLITLPLGVLQAGRGDRGAVQFIPDLPPQKQEALCKLVMGKVVRVVLRFRERFWERVMVSHCAEPKALSEMSFLFSHDDWFPTWWTTMPDKLPVITAWAPFHWAEKLPGRDEAYVVDRAVETLSGLLKTKASKLKDLLEASYFHDWQSDPFSRGAYSYVKVGGLGAQQELARPLANTLFFAGEATDYSGHHGTVHGAIASGQRAADEIKNAK
jgi:monoamine oxidase